MVRYGTVNEEEFIEAESRRIKAVLIFASIWLLILPPVFLALLYFLLQSGSIVFFFAFLLIFIAFPPFFILTYRRAKRPYGLWISWEKMVIIFFKYLSLPIVAGILASFELPIYHWAIRGDFHQIDIVNIIPLLGMALPTPVFLLFWNMYRRRRENFEENRNVLLKIPIASAKEIILKTLDNLNLPYSRPKGLFGLPDERKFVELESGIKIGVGQNFRDCLIFISDIPKGDTIEPKIEAEILRLAGFSESD